MTQACSSPKNSILLGNGLRSTFETPASLNAGGWFDWIEVFYCENVFFPIKHDVSFIQSF